MESPLLVIGHDQDAESPRKWGNIGYFYTKENNYNSPDGTGEIYRIMLRAGEEAQNTEDHMQIMGELVNSETGENVLAIYPVTRYEHGNVVYSIGSGKGFDSSNCGFYIITDKSHAEMPEKKSEWERIVSNELEIYSQWCNGEVYQFALYNEKGELEDSCNGFYDIEDIREYLPESWKGEDLRKYLK